LTLSSEVEYEVEYEVGRRWQEQWGRIERRHVELQAIYADTDARPPNTWKAVMGDFSVAVHHLADWFDKDPSVPGPVGADAWSVVNSDPALSLAAAVSNSYKHHTRRSGIQADISSVRSSSGGNEVRIGWRDMSSGASGVKDGLVLADDCVTAWKAFMARHSLDPDS
jgi:hypothetical protein